MPFENLIGLWALSAVVIFIILYLRQPKPQDRVIPSLMFLMSERKELKQYSFLRKLLQNLLFFLQLAALLGLALAIAAPYIRTTYSVTSDNTIIILDSSASMQTKDGITTRFDKAIDEAKKQLSGRVTLILAENNPLILLEDGKKDEALDLLTKIKPKATTTNLGDALLLANDILGNRKGKVIVISDFIATEGADPLVAKRTLTSGGSLVDFIPIGNKARNIGIIELKAEKYQSKVYVKNFNDKEETITIKLTKNGEVKGQSKPIKLLPDSVESFVFDNTPTEVSRIEIDAKDDLDVDNYAYISAPSKRTVSVLLITNAKSSPIIAALKASKDITLTIAEPPVVPEFTHDIIIVNQFSDKLLLPGTFKDIKSYVQKGGNFIITPQEDLSTIGRADLIDILPVEITGSGERSRVCAKIFNQFTKQFEKEPCFTRTSKYFKSKAKDNSTLVIAESDDNSPLIAYKDNIIYYGIFDDDSDFKTLPSYPIFWNEIVNFLVKTEDIRDFNFRSGDAVVIEEQKVKTPSGYLTTSKLILDEAGVYELKDKKIAVNLLNEKESDIAVEPTVLKQDKEEFSSEKIKELKNLYFEMPLAIIVFLVLCFELLYIKIRGDL